MNKKWKSIKIGKRVVKSHNETYFKLKENARKQKLSLADYLSKLIYEDEITGVRRDISKHIGALDNLLTQYMDVSFSEPIAYLRVIVLRYDKLEPTKKNEFIDFFNEKLIEVMEKMGQISTEKE